MNNQNRNLQQLRKEFTTFKIKPTEWLGDSPTRFDDYTRYATGCETILELGVYTGLATCAFLLAQPKKITSIDITSEYLKILEDLNFAADKQNTHFQFFEMNDLEFANDGQDLLFIDTTHTYEQTKEELKKFGHITKKRIVLHDIASHFGVYRAVVEWLWENKDFFISEHDNRGDGIIVLQKYSGT
jgi:hypothetical protein